MIANSFTLFSCKQKLYGKRWGLAANSCLFFLSHYTSVLVFSFGFYSINQFSELSLFCFWKGQIKTKNVLLVLFCRIFCFYCHHSQLINFSVKYWKFQGIWIWSDQNLMFLCLIKQDFVSPFLFPHSGFWLIWYYCITFHRDHIYFITCFIEIFWCMVF